MAGIRINDNSEELEEELRHNEKMRRKFESLNTVEQHYVGYLMTKDVGTSNKVVTMEEAITDAISLRPYASEEELTGKSGYSWQTLMATRLEKAGRSSETQGLYEDLDKEMAFQPPKTEELVEDIVQHSNVVNAVFRQSSEEQQKEIREAYKIELEANDEVERLKMALANAERAKKEAVQNRIETLAETAQQKLDAYLQEYHNEFILRVRWNDKEHIPQEFKQVHGEDLVIPVGYKNPNRMNDSQISFMVLKDGDYINVTNPNDIYGVHRTEYQANYHDPSLEELYALDRGKMTEAQKVAYIILCRQSMSDEEKIVFNDKATELWESKQYHSSNECDIRACDYVMEERLTKEKENSNEQEVVQINEENLNKLCLMDKSKMSEEQQFEYVMTARKTFSDEEQLEFDLRAGEAFGEKYNSTLDADLEACDLILRKRYDLDLLCATKSFDLDLETLCTVDKMHLSDEEKATYVHLGRSIMSPKEEEEERQVYLKLWNTKYNNTLDAEVEACDIVLKQHYERVAEETRKLEESMRDLDDELRRDYEATKGQTASKVSDYAHIFEDEPVQIKSQAEYEKELDSLLGKVGINVENLSKKELNEFYDKAGKEFLDVMKDTSPAKEVKDNDISISPYELQSKDNLMSEAILGLSAENNEYIVYMKDTRCSYSLGNDVTKVYDELYALTDKMMNGVKITPLQENVDVNKIDNIRDLNEFAIQETVLGNKAKFEVSEDLVLGMLSEQRKVNMQHLAIVGPGMEYDKAFLVDNNYNRVAILENDNMRGIVDNKLGEACKVHTPLELAKYADADLVLHNHSEVINAIKSAQSVYIDKRGSRGFESVIETVSEMRNGRNMPTLSAFEAGQCYNSSGPIHRFNGLANKRGKSMELTQDDQKGKA